MSEPLNIEVEPNEVVRIEGIRYSFSLFRALAFGKIGTVFRIESRDDGVVTLTVLERPE